MKVTVVNTDNKRVSDVELDEGIFAVQGGTGAIYEVVKMQLASRRKGSASSRGRSEVAGTTAKMYRQKGTGRARHGSYKANIFVGGGKAFGPHPRDFSYGVPKKMRRRALRAVLSQKARDGKLIVVDSLSLPGAKTKAFVERMKALKVESALFVLDEISEAVEKSARNVSTAKLLRCEGLNVVDLLRYDSVVLTQGALTKVQEVLKP